MVRDSLNLAFKTASALMQGKQKDKNMQATQFAPVTESTTAGNGQLVIIRAGATVNGKEKTPLALGLVVEGRYEGAVPNKFNPESLDYRVRTGDGTLYILASCANLKRDFAKVGNGELIQVQYNGKRNMTGKNAGKTVQDFKVLRAINEAG